jgi:hypothetical protein
MTTTEQQAALLTKHQKLTLIAPALAQVGIIVELTEAYDTDQLGTFSAEIPRTQSPLDCAKTKAKLACEATGLAMGIGSEGSFGGGPAPGLLNWDDELLCLFDRRKGQFIIAYASGPVPLSDLETDQIDRIRQHLEQHDATQGWILRYGSGLTKGLIGFDAFYGALQQANLISHSAQLQEVVRVSPDLRAHLCPARQRYIQQAAAQLADRLQAFCPVCQAADFWRKERETGLPCSACSYPTQRVKYYIKRCDCCGHTEQEAATEALADPTYCPLCNP